MSNLAGRAAIGYSCLIVAMAALLFVPAWTIAYWQAWAYLVHHVHYTVPLASRSRVARAASRCRASGRASIGAATAAGLCVAGICGNFLGCFSRSSTFMVERTGSVIDHRRLARRPRAPRRVPRLSRKYVRRRNDRRDARSTCGVERTVRDRSPPDVRRRAGILNRDADRARLGLGAHHGRGVDRHSCRARGCRRALLSRPSPGYSEYLEKVRWRFVPFLW
jgi:hypothetical protein